MKRGTYIKVFVVSITAALVLSSISLLCLIKFSDLAFRDHRKNLMLFIARSIENNPNGLALPQMPFGPRPGGPPPGMPGGHGPHGPPAEGFRDNFPPPPPPGPGMMGGPGGPRMGPPPPPPGGGEAPEFWIISETREVISDNKIRKLPAEVAKLDLPKEVHATTSSDTFWNFFDRTTIMRLDHEGTKAYLVLNERRNPFRGPLFVTQGIFTFATVVIALFFALTITFYYLRKKSDEARAVLLSLERGDLKARFDIKPFDEFGGLLLDFNRMANEIERLVNRVRETEMARSNLLSELGHDLRTPLTSLTTSFETLKFHFNKMTPSDRNEIFTMITAEVEYFKELLEKLMTIAELDEPHYKKSTDAVDLATLIGSEVRYRSSSAPQFRWTFNDEGMHGQPPMVLGDSYLLLRLLKNAFDNATRYAKEGIHASLTANDEYVQITIKDDGPGMDADALANFGKRQERRKRREESQGLNFSLGLGSVIMRTIAELHGGSLEVANRASVDGVSGTIVRVKIPKFETT
ncbi:HAMP domain-containing sensor histidine kinase [Bdellovibrio sp. NC01]|uniref:sensor histidine kinase n=1 Tax=Bdellovibrio sp. NC01 TaxID=2220073 RepID=UPI0011598105|nr:HAMP domain-containing sensor histidine kinase [Bdellovibrio sp. NC01]QDK38949.1 sensor protein kdpD [Bdellovibrio sp. NC01]